MIANKELYDAIFHRCSVRRFAPAPLTAAQLADIESFLAQIKSPAENVNVSVRLLAPTQVGRAITGPHYAAAYAGEGMPAQTSAGYHLELLALYLAAKGLGCCYSGMAKPHESCRVHNGAGAAMVMVLGTPEGEASRSGIGAFKRKELSAIATADVPKTIAEAVRLAPSGMNTQPWLLTGDKSAVELRYCPSGFAGLTSKMLSYPWGIEMGIALAHLHIAARQMGMSCRFDFAAQPGQPLPKRQQLACRVYLEAV